MQQTGSVKIIKHIGHYPSSAIYLYNVKSSFNNYSIIRFGNAGAGYFYNKPELMNFSFKVLMLSALASINKV